LNQERNFSVDPERNGHMPAHSSTHFVAPAQAETQDANSAIRSLRIPLTGTRDCLVVINLAAAAPGSCPVEMTSGLAGKWLFRTKFPYN